MSDSDYAFADGMEERTGWFDLHRTSLEHLADLLANFDLVDRSSDPPSDYGAPARDPGGGASGSHPARDREGSPTTGAGLGSRAPAPPATPTGSQSVPQVSSPLGNDHPTRVYQSAGLRIFADDPRARGRFDDVPGPGPSSSLVADLTVKRPAAHALDLGCGGGYLSLLLADFSEVVVGIDLNPRAVQIARINARWNKVRNVEFRTGDLFEPVGDKRFNLIVSNTPFVISPDHDFIYRDGGGKPGAITDRIMADLPELLTEEGFATVLCHWPVRSGEVWWRQPAAWVESSSCSLWLISYGMQPPERYARTWLENARPGAAVSAQSVSRWLDWYEARSIDHIAAGVLVLRKRTSGENWARAIVAPRQPTGDCSPHLLRIFEAHDHLTAITSPDELLDIPLGFPPGCRVSIEEGGSDGEVGRVTLEPDPGFSLAVSDAALALISSLDGTLAPRALLGEQPEAARRHLEQSLTSALLRLYGAGMLVAGDRRGGPPVVDTY